MMARAVTVGAGRDIGVWKALLIDFLSRRYELLRSAPQGSRIEVLEMRGEGGQHGGTQHVRHTVHELVLPPAVDERVQLVLEILGLLPGEARDRVGAMIALPVRAVTGLAIGELRVEVLLRDRRSLRMSWQSGNDCQHYRRQRQSQQLHDPGSGCNIIVSCAPLVRSSG